MQFLRIYYNQALMQKQKAEPIPTPFQFPLDQPEFPALLWNLSLSDKKQSNEGTQSENRVKQLKKSEGKTKSIGKQTKLKRSYKQKIEPLKKQNYKKKVMLLEKKVTDLETEIDRLKRKMQVCPECRYYSHKNQQSDKFQSFRPDYENEMKKIACNLNDSRGSMNSVEFQNIDFNAPMMMTNEVDDKSWVYTGVLMIAMGSKCLEVDGSINVFRILKQSVDTLRRQVEKSQSNISLDFYLTQQQMKENQFMEEVGFDPFTQKIGGETGLSLEGVKVQSVEQFELIYDNKLTYNIKYEALLGAMEYLRENSWLTF